MIAYDATEASYNAAVEADEDERVAAYKADRDAVVARLSRPRTGMLARRTSLTAAAGPVVKMATDNQVDYLDGLTTKLGRVNAETAQVARTWLDTHTSLDGGVRHATTLTFARASDAIGRLLAHIAAAPAPAARDPYTDVHDGYYATTAAGGQTAFYRISTRKTGARKAQAQAGDQLHPARADVVLAAIRAAGPQAAAERYAAELGRCYRCHIELTDPISRGLGIGPKCRKGGHGDW